MPHISRSNNNLQAEGPHVEISIFPSIGIYNSHASAGTTCPTKKVLGLIDTGATGSAIDDSVATELGLIARDKRTVLTPSGTSEQFLYDIGLLLPIQGIRIIPLQVLGATLTDQPYKALIGRDLLRFCNLFYCGGNGFWSLSL